MTDATIGMAAPYTPDGAADGPEILRDPRLRAVAWKDLPRRWPASPAGGRQRPLKRGMELRRSSG
ncbi:MAG TPA: hypothetical protein VHG08_20710 [Longimicrobium sp.]|nr:hypothetical protein [Longimicrobium sp.]